MTKPKTVWILYRVDKYKDNTTTTPDLVIDNEKLAMKMVSYRNSNYSGCNTYFYAKSIKMVFE